MMKWRAVISMQNNFIVDAIKPEVFFKLTNEEWMNEKLY